MSEDWLDLLRGAVTRLGSKQAAADAIGISRSAVSLALASKYPGDTKKLEAKVLRKLGSTIECPHLNETLTFEECSFHRTRGVPTSSHTKLQHWLACQTCPVGDRLGIARSRHHYEVPDAER